MAPEFLLFALTLLGVAVLHRYALPIAACGLALILACEWGFTQFPGGAGWPGLAAHFAAVWVTLANLLLLLGFTLVARHFEESGIPAALPRYLPDDWTVPLRCSSSSSCSHRSSTTSPRR